MHLCRPNIKKDIQLMKINNIKIFLKNIYNYLNLSKCTTQFFHSIFIYVNSLSIHFELLSEPYNFILLSIKICLLRILYLKI